MKTTKSESSNSSQIIHSFYSSAHSLYNRIDSRLAILFQKRFTVAVRSSLFLAAMVGAQYAGSALPLIQGEGDSMTLNSTNPLIIERVTNNERQSVTVEILAQDNQRIFWDHKLVVPPYRFTTSPGAHTLTVHDSDKDPEIQLLEFQSGISTFIRTY